MFHVVLIYYLEPRILLFGESNNQIIDCAQRYELAQSGENIPNISAYMAMSEQIVLSVYAYVNNQDIEDMHGELDVHKKFAEIYVMTEKIGMYCNEIAKVKYENHNEYK